MNETHPETAAVTAVFDFDGAPAINISGQWLEHDLRTAGHPLGQLVLAGQCPVDQATVEQTLARAVEQGRPELIADLPGSHTAFLRQADSLTVMTDPLGQSPVYSTTDGRRITVSTEPSLSSPHAGLLPDLNHAMAQLVIPGAEGLLLGDSSSLEGVQKSHCGQTLQITDGRMLRHDGTPFTPDRHADKQELVEEFGRALQQAVGGRFAGGELPSSDFSGGMDSSSLAFLALAYAGDKEVPVYLHKLLGVPNGDEAYVEQFIGLRPGLDLRRIETDPLDKRYSFEDFLRTPRPEDLSTAINMSANGWKAAQSFYEVVAADGFRQHITGHGGDEIAGVQSSYLANLANLRGAGRFLSEGLAYARFGNVSPVKLWMAKAALSRLSPADSVRQIAYGLDDADAGFEQPDVRRAKIWKLVQAGAYCLTPQARLQLQDYLHERAAGLELPEGYRIADYTSLRFAQCLANNTNLLRFCAAAAGGVSMQTPFLDRHVVRASLTLPAEDRGSPDQARLILQQALGDVIPPEVFQRRTKSAWDEPVSRTFMLSKPAISQVLKESYLADLGIIDPSRVRQGLEQMDVLPMEFIWSLDRILSVEGWLRKLDASRPSPAVGRPAPIVIERSSKPETTPDDDQHYTMPAHVYAIASDTGSMIIYNQLTDKYHTLDPARANMLRAVAATGDRRTALDVITRIYPTADKAVLVEDFATCLQESVRLGIVVSGDDSQAEPRLLPTRPGRIGFSGTETAAASGLHNEQLPLRDRVLTTGAYIVGQVLQRTAPRARLPLLRMAQAKLANREASYDEARDLLLAAQTIPTLGRVACAESSYAAALAGAFRRLKVDWHQGASFRPMTFHAWIEAEGRAVYTPLNGQASGSFQSFFG